MGRLGARSDTCQKQTQRVLFECDHCSELLKRASEMVRAHPPFRQLLLAPPHRSFHRADLTYLTGPARARNVAADVHGTVIDRQTGAF